MHNRDYLHFMLAVKIQPRIRVPDFQDDILPFLRRKYCRKRRSVGGT